MKGSLGPEFTVMTNRGDSMSTKPNQGKAMILYFWATTKFAPPEFARSDAEDMAALNALYHKFSNRADFIGLPFNDSVTVKEYLKEHPLDFPQAMGGATADKELYITQYTTPLVIFINSKGRVVNIRSGSLRKRDLIIKKYTPIVQACLSGSAEDAK
ncbi:TlpA family protein disulfide reductase [Hymenobacter ruricola]|uniref:Redoxin domain-containing protein n=1 Tax=Hymenobacter ruricola TaxID=2791023 RepID=A0ABS0HYE3_9BACT|nr:redoxin domain-containing protein [Hymenobacter ruricola]MBF9219649.1 redoxin domain-containing protein [Hymenobacter ruricola]